MKLKTLSTSPCIHGSCNIQKDVGNVCSYVLGHEAMRKMIHSNVLIIGLKGLGVELGLLKDDT